MDRPYWFRPPQDLPTLSSTVSADVCVVGLGGTGLAAVHRALSHGCTVVGLDAETVAAGAAGRNGGFLLAGPAHFHHHLVREVGSELARELYQASLHALDHMAAETPDLIERRGSVRVGRSPEEHEDIREHFDALRADAFPVSSYLGPEGRGILLPTDGTVDPTARHLVRAEAALARGARLYANSPARLIDGRLRDDEGRVHTPHGVVRCDHVVVAVDGLLTRLVPDLAERVHDVRLQMLATAPTDAVTVRHAVYARWGYDYWQQRPDGVLLVGGKRDVGGPRERTAEARADEVVQSALDRLLRDELGVDVEVTHRWAGIVGYTDDHLPILEPVDDGVVATGGYSGTGNVLGWLCGRAAVDQALGRVAPFATLLAEARATLRDRAERGTPPTK